MTGSDLIVLLPWIIFAVGVVVLGISLWCARRSARRPPSAKRRRR